MKKYFNLKILFTLLFVSLIFSVNTYAEDIDSNNLKILDFSFSTTGSNNLEGTNSKLLLTGDTILNDMRFNSEHYRIGVGAVNTWQANVPLVHCFETTTSGSSGCNNPAIINGMIQVCGQGGCFNKARFEIDPQSNPTDTLYSVQITTDSNWNSWQYIDGATFLIEEEATHDIDDYLTQSSWENPIFNILSLTPNTTYYIRITALHGDFTESIPGSAQSATTAYPQIIFDIDVSDTAGSTAETSSPYLIDLGTLTYNSVTTASDLIWFDLGTNMTSGASIFGTSINYGLYSASVDYTILAVNDNLDNVFGYGLQNFNISETFLGPLIATTNFNQAGNTVGAVTSNPGGVEILNTSGEPIFEGRAAFYIKAKMDESTLSASDYSETIIFTVQGKL